MESLLIKECYRLLIIVKRQCKILQKWEKQNNRESIAALRTAGSQCESIPLRLELFLHRTMRQDCIQFNPLGALSSKRIELYM